MSNNLLLLILILILIIVYLYIFVKKIDMYEDYPLYQYNDIKKKLKTGDIIFFSYTNHNSLCLKIQYFFRTKFLGCYYGHVGLIYRYGNEIYVVECTSDNHCADDKANRLNKKSKHGIRLIELDTLLYEYDKVNSALFSVKFISKEIPNNVFIKNLNKYNNIVFESKSLIFTIAFIDLVVANKISKYLLDKIRNDKRMTCGEFVHHFLYNCGVLKNYDSKMFWPHLINSEVFDDLQIIKYSRPYRFVIGNKNINR